MDFVDWRNRSDKHQDEQQAKAKPGRFRGRAYMNYIEEQIREAEERGVFENLPGFGKPLNLDDNFYAGDKAMGYHLLKSNGYAPSEIELVKEIRAERERAEAKTAKVVRRSKFLRSRRVPPFPSEKRAFNTSVEKTASEYEQVLRNLNRKILTLNIQVPSTMQQSPLQVEQLVTQFREACPLFENVLTRW